MSNRKLEIATGPAGKSKKPFSPSGQKIQKENRLQFVTNFMHNLLARIQDAREEAGQTLVEYGLILALISIVAIAALTLIGGNVTAVFNSIAGELGSTP
jgi:pilus assembly protein Flp/PilA